MELGAAASFIGAGSSERRGPAAGGPGLGWIETTMRKGNDSSSDDDEDEEEMKALRDARRKNNSRGPPELGDDAFVPRQASRAAQSAKSQVVEVLDDAEEAAAEDDLRLSFPLGFGKQKTVQSLEQVHASTRRQTAPDLQAMVKEAEAASKGLQLSDNSQIEQPATESKGDGPSDDESDDDDDDGAKKIADCIPCSHEAVMKVLQNIKNAKHLDIHELRR